jgi:hypothetical protein
MTEEVAVTQTNLPGTPTLNFISSGKVRDLYEIRDTETGDEYLLFVATDRISAYDVILKNVSAYQLIASSRLLTMHHRGTNPTLHFRRACRESQTKAVSSHKYPPFGLTSSNT